MKLKLNQKKLIAIASLMIVGIVTLTFALNNKDKGSETAKNNETNELNQEEADSQASSFAKPNTEADLESTQESAEAEEKFAFEVNADPEVVDLITQYMNAKLEPSVEILTPLVNDVSLIDVEGIERETKIIERYDNITLHSTDVPEEESSLIYVYHEVKILGIETPAPTATKFIVVKEADQAPRIYNGEISEETNEFIAEFEQSDAYKAFIEDINTKFQEALGKDQVLAEFYAKLNESNKEAEVAATDETETSVETSESEETPESEEASVESEQAETQANE